MDAPAPIAIAGGGIAGLASALALAAAGIRVRLYERVPALLEVGAGIQLSPNAGRILERLGLGPALDTVSHEPVSTVLIDGPTGQRLCAIPFRGLMRQRYGAPYRVVHRADLQAVLQAAATSSPRIEYVPGTAVTGWSENGSSLSVSTSDDVGTASAPAFALVVADGINSTLRPRICGAVEPARDQTAWRGTVPLDKAKTAGMDADETAVVMADGHHAVFYRLGQRESVNVVLISGGTRSPSDCAGAYARKPWRMILDAVDNWREWPLRAVDAPAWHRGRAVLVGDAAHAMTPHAAQGGAMAIEDAAGLARALAGSSDPAASLAAFERLRRPRVERVAALSTSNRRIYQLGGAAALARNAVLRLTPGHLALRRMDWLYEA